MPRFPFLGKIPLHVFPFLGRPKGRKTSPEKYKLHKKATLIKELLKAEVSQRKIAKICKVDRNTLSRYIKAFLTDI